LRHAAFELTLESVELTSSNYPVAELGEGNWTFERRQFMPEKDWVFTFKSKGEKS
jgi:hypothetical protein